MNASKKKLLRILDVLERTFGRVKVPKRAASAEKMLIRANCGYPASDEACDAGWAALEASVGTSIDEIRAAPKKKLVAAMRAGGIIAEARAERLLSIAVRINSGSNLRDRKQLKKFPTIGDPGADKILLFSRAEAIAAVPSNATQVPIRIGLAEDRASYGARYRSIQKAFDAALPKTADARIRAYLVVRRHGETICKRSKPRCDACPLTRECDYFRARAEAYDVA